MQSPCLHAHQIQIVEECEGISRHFAIVVIQSDGLVSSIPRQLYLAQELRVHDACGLGEERLPRLVQYLAVHRPAHGKEFLICDQLVQVPKGLVSSTALAGDGQNIVPDALEHPCLLPKSLEVRMGVVAVVELSQH